MAGWLERRISRHDYSLSKGFLAVSVLFVAIWMNVPKSCGHSQSDPSQQGFISISCGSDSDYNDTNGLLWVTDVNSTFINTGSVFYNETANESSRVFPERRNKNCYELQPVSPNTTYLFRAGFYFDFQMMASLPISFDVSINATTVFTINFDSDTVQPGEYEVAEIIVFSPGNVTYVCLRPGDGVPFITTLELRPLDPAMYSYSGSQTQYLVNLERWNIGASSNASSNASVVVRYPDDQYDRIWFDPDSTWQDLFPRVSASVAPDRTPRPEVNSVPPLVMQDAWGGVNMSILWPNIFTTSGWPVIVNPGQYAYVAVYTEELNISSIGGEMNIVLDNYPGQIVNVSSQAKMLANPNFILSANGIEFEIFSPQNDMSAISVNAIEFYGQYNFNFSTTAPDDDSAVTYLKESFSLMDWQGDPCTPVPHDWLSCEVVSFQGSADICQKTDSTCNLEPSFLRSTYSVVALNLSNLPASGFGLLQNYVASSDIMLTSLTQMSITESGINGSIFQFLINDFCDSEDLQYLDFTGNNIESLPTGEGWGQLYQLVYLNLSKNSITGNLRPFDNASFVDSLQVLNVSYNSMTSITNNTWTNGTTALVALDLSHNDFVDDISSLDALVQLSAGTLQELYVSNNSFTGTLSPLYFSLPNLTIAYFDGNSIQGTLNLTAWLAALDQDSSTNSSTMTQKLFSFVGNSISNIVPSAAAMDSTITSLRKSNLQFRSNGILLGGNPYCKSAKSETEQYLCRSHVNGPIIPPRDRNDTVMIIGICVGLGALLVACAAAATMWKLWKKAKKKVHALEEIQRALADRKVQPPFFQYGDLRSATKNFHKDNLLGRGSFGEVHRGVLPDNTNLAVKTLFNSGQALDEFLNEVVLITGIKHRNLVQLMGCCIDNDQRPDQRMLVYEFAEKGNLAEALWGSKTHESLNWKQRLNICVGVARGLSYLHEELQPAIIHRDIKPENILIDKNLQPKIADFGLARVFSGDTSEAMYTKIAGTLGYFAPEYATQGQLSEKVDVYSYGIVVLETISGRKCIDDSQPIERVYLKDWVHGLKKNGLLFDALQYELRNSCETSEVLQAINIGLQCVHHDPASRPSMSEVVSMFVGRTRNDPFETSLEMSRNGHRIEDVLGITTQQLGLPSACPFMGAKSDEIPLINFEASSSGSRKFSRGPSSKTMIQLSPLVGR